MSIFMTLRIAVKALNRNKMRTILTMLGMIIGVGAVITMVALGKGAQSTIEEQVKAAGTNMINVNAGNFSQGGVRMGGGNATTLTPADVEAIKRAAERAVRRRGREVARPAHRGQPELVEPDPGHRRGPAADSQLADEIRQLLHRPGRGRRRQGLRAGPDRRRHALRAGRRSDRPDHPGQESALQDHWRDGLQGDLGHGGRSGRHRVRAVHDRAEETAGHPAHQ